MTVAFDDDDLLDEPTEADLYGMWPGEVVDNVDPEGRGRVRAYIPGLTESEDGQPKAMTGWAIPMWKGGRPQRGEWDVPEVGASLAVWFALGDIDRPYYLCTGPGDGELPTAVQAVPISDRPKIHVLLETKHYHLYVDDRDGKERVVFEHKTKPGNLLELSGADQGLILRAVNVILVESLTGIVQKALGIFLNRRWLQPGEKPL